LVNRQIPARALAIGIVDGIICAALINMATDGAICARHSMQWFGTVVIGDLDRWEHSERIPPAQGGE
jgi:hypothetical protein